MKTKVSKKEFEAIIDLIASDFELVAAPAIKNSELDYSFLKLTTEQMALLDYLSEQKTATIQGTAGTGKTLLAKESARRFGMDGRKVLFLCFNRFLYMDLQHRYPYSNVTYYNIHTFIALYRPGCSTSSVEMRCKELQMIDISSLDYDDVIIDEAQDFDNDEILYFKRLTEAKNGHFYTFYDKNQLVTTKRIPEWIQDSECKLLLSKNCRNTREIALTSSSVIDISIINNTDMLQGEQPSISFSSDEPLSQLYSLIRRLMGDKYKFQLNDIVILTLKTEDDSILSEVNNLHGIPITKERSNSSVFFTTARKFKGLESRVVIVIDIDKNCFVDDEKKRVFYVACSRATHQLSLLVNADDDEINIIADAINTNRRFAPKGIIAMKTQTKILDL